MRDIKALRGDVAILGFRVPKAVALIVALTLASTLAAALALRTGVPLAEVLALVPARVWRGEVWRLVTWVFLEFSLAPLGLVLACACLVSVGRELTYRLGATRFLVSYVALAVLSGAGTCLVAWVWPAVMTQVYASAWVPVAAVFVAWAILVPGGTLLVSFVLPVTGRQIIWVTLAIAVLSGFFYGFAAVVPELLAILITMVAFKDRSLYYLWLRLRLATVQHPFRQKRRHLRAVEREDDDRPRWLH